MLSTRCISGMYIAATCESSAADTPSTSNGL